MNKKRTAIGELEWVIQQINIAHHDRNPNRAAQIDGLCKYGINVAISHRSKEPLPARPDMKRMV